MSRQEQDVMRRKEKGGEDRGGEERRGEERRGEERRGKEVKRIQSVDDTMQDCSNSTCQHCPSNHSCCLVVQHIMMLIISYNITINQSMMMIYSTIRMSHLTRRYMERGGR